MSRDAGAAPVRCLAVWAATTAGAAALVTWLLPHLLGLAAGSRSRGFEALLVSACEAAAIGCAAWLWLLVTLVVRDALCGRHPSAEVPGAVRRLVLAVCGLSLASGLAQPAAATGGDAAGESPAAVLAGLSLPDRTTTAEWLGAVARSYRAPTVRAVQRSRPSTVVRRGDSLWSIAERTLPAGATAAEIDRTWRLIHRANRSVIGPDPDLLRPGQRLWLPDTRR